MSEMTTYRWSLLDDVTHYREAEIEAIGIWRPKLVEFGEERGIELVRDSGLSVSSISWAGGFTGSNGHSFYDVMDDVREAIRIAAEFDAECVNIVSGSRAGHTLNHARRLLIAALKDLGYYAAEFGVTLAVQPMHQMFSNDWTFLTSTNETLDILQTVNLPSVKMGFDVYHLWQESRLLERIPEIVPHIAIVQLSDWREPPRSEHDRYMLGDGIIPLDRIVGSLIEAGYCGYFDIQIWSEELWESDYIRLLNRCRSGFADCIPHQAISPSCS